MMKPGLYIDCRKDGRYICGEPTPVTVIETRTDDIFVVMVCSDMHVLAHKDYLEKIT
tara:strand:+ start:1173 stop:1343 length:171 start_codon:yes stop_codon:yes gene_type:complete